MTNRKCVLVHQQGVKKCKINFWNSLKEVRRTLVPPSLGSTLALFAVFGPILLGENCILVVVPFAELWSPRNHHLWVMPCSVLSVSLTGMLRLILSIIWKPFLTSSLDIFRDISGIVSGGSSHVSSRCIASGSSKSESLKSPCSKAGAKRSVIVSSIQWYGVLVPGNVYYSMTPQE